MKKIVFVIKSSSGLKMSNPLAKKLVDKIWKIIRNNKTIIFQVDDSATTLTLWIKRRAKNIPELYNIALAEDDMKQTVIRTIDFIHKYVESEEILIILVDSRDFIVEFAKLMFDKRLNYSVDTDPSLIKVLDCETFRIYSA